MEAERLKQYKNQLITTTGDNFVFEGEELENLMQKGETFEKETPAEADAPPHRAASQPAFAPGDHTIITAANVQPGEIIKIKAEDETFKHVKEVNVHITYWDGSTEVTEIVKSSANIIKQTSGEPTRTPSAPTL